MEEQNIPIDINTTKLLDWLVSRRHIAKDWQNGVLKVREKINNAIQDMPAHEGIVKLVSGQHINYFHCLKILDILRETEKDTKNIFGKYGSQRMKDWQDIIASYQKDNLYLAEVASILIRNVSYEIPSIRKQVQKLEQQQVECEKKIKDCNKSEAVSQREFNQLCEQLGIKGDNIKVELLELIKELPEINKGIAEKIKIVKPAIELYAAFNKFLSGQDIDFDSLPTLSYLIDEGNTTTYEYIHGEKPVEIQEDVIKVTEEESKGGTGEIDFGDGGEIDFGGEEIDFGDQIIVESPNNPVQSIGSSRGSSNEESFEIVNYEELNTELNSNLEESGIVLEKSGNDGGIAKGDAALTILDNPKYRDQIVNDLCELEAFIKMRLFEMCHESDLLSMSQMQEAPSVLQLQTVDTVTALIDCVNVAIGQLTNKRTQHLFDIKHSPKYVDILTSNLKQKLSVVERMKATKSVVEAKLNEYMEEVRKLDPLIKKAINNTKLLQKEIQEDISKKYKGRIVNIVGGVNTL